METALESFTRQYTILHPPLLAEAGCKRGVTLNTFDVLVKLYEGGRASERIRDWAVGQQGGTSIGFCLGQKIYPKTGPRCHLKRHPKVPKTANFLFIGPKPLTRSLPEAAYEFPTTM